jgi:hypothetical protein
MLVTRASGQVLLAAELKKSLPASIPGIAPHLVPEPVLRQPSSLDGVHPSSCISFAKRRQAPALRELGANPLYGVVTDLTAKAHQTQMPGVGLRSCLAAGLLQHAYP